jgi:hypothetical protein
LFYGKSRQRSSNGGGRAREYGAKKFVLNQFEFSNNHQQVVLQEKKDYSEEERAQAAGQTYPNEHADSLQSIWS